MVVVGEAALKAGRVWVRKALWGGRISVCGLEGFWIEEGD